MFKFALGVAVGVPVGIAFFISAAIWDYEQARNYHLAHNKLRPRRRGALRTPAAQSTFHQARFLSVVR